MNILTLKVGDKYSPDYVNRLYKGFKRNSSVPFDFYCYTENSDGLDDNISVIELTKREEIKQHWYKFDFHDMSFLMGKKCFIMDIDVVVTGNVDDLINFDLPKGNFGACNKWWGNNKFNGGFQMFYQGETKYLRDEFLKNPKHWQSYYYEAGRSPYLHGEQLFIEEHLQQDVTFLPKEWLARYGNCKGKTGAEGYNLLEMLWKQNVDSQSRMVDLNGKINEKIKLVHFSGPSNFIEHHDNASFVKDNWLDS